MALYPSRVRSNEVLGRHTLLRLHSLEVLAYLTTQSAYVDPHPIVTYEVVNNYRRLMRHRLSCANRDRVRRRRNHRVWMGLREANDRVFLTFDFGREVWQDVRHFCRAEGDDKSP